MDVKALVSQMTLEEKAGLCSGLDFWHTKPVERLGVPATMVSDGPHGLRKQDQKADHLGVNDSIKAVCMPAACATAASFDRELIHKMGQAIGDSCQHEELSVVLGPAVNIKRSPLCGRNFEYFSEDPYLAGEMSASYINGVQSRNVGTSIKHFAANSQEHRRMSSSSNADERTLREIYFPAFETSVKKAQPWTVMCSYNRINGVYASENPWLLTEVLRNEWGFEGYVMSDWGAVSDRVAGVAAGLDLEMPSSGGINDRKIVEAVRSGKLDEAKVDLACERILNIVYRYVENAKPETPWDQEADHLLSAKIASECMVLLKNNGLLPLSKEDDVAFIGEFAAKPRFQGGGSSHINCFKTTSALKAAEGLKVTYAQGYSAALDTTTDEQIAEASAAYDALSEADQAALDEQTSLVNSQSYGRVLETAQWALEAIKAADNRTSLPNGLYNADSFPGLTSEYSKGKSSSMRQRPWSVKDVCVVDGKATGTVMVESSTYTYIYMAGKRFENTAKEGEYSTFTNVPIDLNSTMYLTGYSTTMLTEIAFSLTTSIQEPEPVGPDPDKPEVNALVEAKAAIALLPANPHKVTNADVDAIAATLKLYEALSSEDKATLQRETLSNGYSYARAVEVASWALQSLAPVDNSTTLADGTYTLAQSDMVTDLGLSESKRQNNWHVDKIMVENGKAFALIVRDGGNTAADTLYLGGAFLKNAATDGSSQFVIPVDLNSDMYFSVLSKNAVDSTNALAYHLNTTFDEENSVPDPVVPSDPASGDDQGETEGVPNNTGTVTAVGTGATLGAAQMAAAKTAATAATTVAEKGAAAAVAGGEGAASPLEALDDIDIPVAAVGSGFAGVALLGGASFWALFRKREEHEE